MLQEHTRLKDVMIRQKLLEAISHKVIKRTYNIIGA
jgi:hypothetical protein